MSTSGSARLALETTLMTQTGHQAWKLSRFFASVVLPDLRLVVQDHVQKRVTDFEFPVVFNIAQFAKLVHEKAHARSGRANHLREGFLTKLPNDRLNRGFFAEIRQKQKRPRQPFLA